MTHHFFTTALAADRAGALRRDTDRRRLRRTIAQSPVRAAPVPALDEVHRAGAAPAPALAAVPVVPAARSVHRAVDHGDRRGDRPRPGDGSAPRAA